MDKLKNINWVMIFSLLLWCAITLIRVMHHSPWYDEAHAWLIAQELNLFEIIKLMKIEGHTFLWYLVLIPFAKSNFMYPYSMLILNWLFCFIAILILWLKSPFNNWVKFLISFSFPFLALYPIVARCYAIGIMFLFSLTAIDKNKLEHPNWYALLLVLCANTSLMAIVGATVFGAIFIYELIKNKKSLLIPFVIMTIGAFLVLIQLLGASNMVGADKPFSLNFFAHLIFNSIVFNFITLFIITSLIFVYCIKNKINMLFLISTFIILFSINCFYVGEIWHRFFYYIYFIMFCWLTLEKYPIIKWNKHLLTIVLGFLSFVYIFYNPGINYYRVILNSESKNFASIILNDDRVSNSTLILYNVLILQEIVPYLKKSNINILSYCTEKKYSYDASSLFNGIDCYNENGVLNANFDGEHFNRLLQDGDNFFIAPSNLEKQQFIPININEKLFFKVYKKLNESFYIYLIEKIKTN